MKRASKIWMCIYFTAVCIVPFFWQKGPTSDFKGTTCLFFAMFIFMYYFFTWGVIALQCCVNFCSIIVCIYIHSFLSFPPTSTSHPSRSYSFPFCCFSVAILCLSFFNPMDYSMPGSFVLHYLQVCWYPCPLSQWCYLTIESSITPFSFSLQSFPASHWLSVLHIIIYYLRN